VIKVIGKIVGAVLHAIASVLSLLPPWLGLIMMFIPGLQPFAMYVMYAGTIAAGIDFLAYAAEGKWAQAKQCLKIFAVGVILAAATWGAFMIGKYVGNVLLANMNIVVRFVSGAVAGAVAGYAFGYAAGSITASIMGLKGEMRKAWMLTQAAAGFWVGAMGGAFEVGAAQFGFGFGGEQSFGESKWYSVFPSGGFALVDRLGGQIWRGVITLGVAGLLYQGRGFHYGNDYVGSRPDGTGYTPEGAVGNFFGNKYGNNLVNYLALIHDRAADMQGYAGNTGYNSRMAWDVGVQLCMLGICF
jgi:hypothetical protein